MLLNIWIDLQALDLSPLESVFPGSGIWARVIYLTLLFWIRRWTSADSCDEWPYMWVCGCLFLYLDFMRTGWTGVICIQNLAIGGSHLRAMLSAIFRMTVHMVLLMFIFILEFYVYETYLLTPDRLAATLMVYGNDNSSIVGVLVYTFSTNIHLPHLFAESMLPTVYEGHKSHDVGNRACNVSRPAGSPISNHMISQSGANFPCGMLRVAFRLIPP